MMPQDLIGIPYRLGARLPGPETDCFGLVVECCKRAGRPIPDPFVSADQPTDVRRWIAERLEGWVKTDRAVPGGVAEFIGTGVPGHVGYLLTDVEFLHSTQKTGSIVSRIDREPWCTRLMGFYVYCG